MTEEEGLVVSSRSCAASGSNGHLKRQQSSVVAVR